MIDTNLKGLLYITRSVLPLMVERNEGVAFLPRMCVEHEVRHGFLREVRVKEMSVERQIRLLYPARRALSHAAQAFLDGVDSAESLG